MTSTTLPVAQSRTRSVYKNVTLWTFQGWIAMFFIAAGYAKLTEPMTNLIALMGWPAVAPENMVRGLGLVEMALGLSVLAAVVLLRFHFGIIRTLMVCAVIGAVWRLAV